MKTEISKSKEEVTLTLDQVEVYSLLEMAEFADFVHSGRTDDDLTTLNFIFQDYVEARPHRAKEALALFGKIGQMYNAFSYYGPFAYQTYQILKPETDKF